MATEGNGEEEADDTSAEGKEAVKKKAEDLEEAGE